MCLTLLLSEKQNTPDNAAWKALQDTTNHCVWIYFHKKTRRKSSTRGFVQFQNEKGAPLKIRVFHAASSGILWKRKDRPQSNSAVFLFVLTFHATPRSAFYGIFLFFKIRCLVIVK